VNGYYLGAALIALSVLVVEAQRHENTKANLRYWKHQHHLEHLVTQRQASRITRLETALGRREQRWVPRRFVAPPVPTADDLARMEDDMAEWTAQVAGLPWSGCDGRPAMVIEDDLSCTPKLSPRASVTTARLRRMVA